MSHQRRDLGFRRIQRAISGAVRSGGRLEDETPYQAVDRLRRRRRIARSAASSTLLVVAVVLGGWWLLRDDGRGADPGEELIELFVCPGDAEPVALFTGDDAFVEAIDSTQDWVRVRMPAPGLDVAWARIADLDVDIIGLASADCSRPEPTPEPTPTPQPTPSPTSEPTPTPMPTPRPPGEFAVLVANGSGIQGAAGQAVNTLSDAGFRALTPRNAEAQERTGVYFRPGFESEAAAVATALGIDLAAVAPAADDLLDDPEAADAQVIVLFGGDSLTG